MKDLDELAKELEPDTATLLRSLRQRFTAVQGLAQRWEPRGPGRGELVLSHTGVELARLAVKAKTSLRLVVGGVEGEEIRGLAGAAAAGDRVRALADARAAAMPQLDFFRKPR